MLNPDIKRKLLDKTKSNPELQTNLLFLVEETNDGKSFDYLIGQIMNSIK